MKTSLKWILPALCLALAANRAFADGAECNGWGDFRGIRVNGQLMPFVSSFKLAAPDGKILAFSATQTTANPTFARTGASQTSSASIYNNGLGYKQTVEDIAPGTAKVSVTVTANRSLTVDGAYYYVTLPANLYPTMNVGFTGAEGNTPAVSADVKLDPARYAERYKLAEGTGKAIKISSPGHAIEVAFDSATSFTVQRDPFIDTDYRVQPELSYPVDPKSLDRVSFCFPLAKGNMTQGQTASATFTIKATGTLDTAPVTLALDAAHPGPGFDGIGGNFRIQGAQDQAHLTYNLENMRVAWGRVEMPLASWWPQENVDPTATTPPPPAPASAPASTPAPGGRGGGGRGGPGGAANPGVRQAMEMAQNLAKRNIPFFISTWGIPQWASAPSPRKPDQPQGIAAGKFNPDKMPAVYKAIGSYLTYLKNNYQAEPVAFSFNESDLGINVLFTPQQHADLIKGLGKYLESQGLKTKMLLADACSSHPLGFVDAAMKDPECRKYIYAISYHSWHDGTPEEFAAWAKVGQELKVPVFCGEGGIDADAHRYSQIFAEPWFDLFEIDTYLGMMQYGQVASVLHWQLTENYGVLAGGRGNAPLQPTRRFFHLKQLDLTPPGTPFLPLVGASPAITHAAYGDPAKGYAVHLLNTGAQRAVTLTGLSASLKEMRVFVTDPQRQMKELAKLPVAVGSVKVTLDPEALTTLTSQ